MATCSLWTLIHNETILLIYKSFASLSLPKPPMWTSRLSYFFYFSSRLNLSSIDPPLNPNCLSRLLCAPFYWWCKPQLLPNLLRLSSSMSSILHPVDSWCLLYNTWQLENVNFSCHSSLNLPPSNGAIQYYSSKI